MDGAQLTVQDELIHSFQLLAEFFLAILLMHIAERKRYSDELLHQLGVVRKVVKPLLFDGK